jgi:hypothetical protein
VPESFIHRQRGTIGHTARPAAGAATAPLATERKRMFAAQPQKTALKTAATEICLELTLNMCRHFHVLGCQLASLRGVGFSDKGCIE